ncbi:MAG: hypothetical protein DYH14_02155, partial [Betaproteobacteria bacterium PRO3]|nr:hypothetical protein [Betaproteobacteria bacterium PRO3]
MTTNDAQPPASAIGQPRVASRHQASASAACAAVAMSEPDAACAANLGPCSSARNTEIGPDVSGSPTMKPPIRS